MAEQGKAASPLARAQGAGGSGHGGEHWWAQRVSALALVPLVVWLLVSLVAMVGAPHAQVIAFLAEPYNAVLMVLLIAAALYHSQLGIQVVIEDYIHKESSKWMLLLLNRFLTIGVGAAAIFAVLRIAL